jgi:predicted phosphoribosyltransferase
MKSNRIFEDRRHAGRELAAAIKRCALRNPLILGLPRGGVPVAYEVAKAVDADLDVLVVRKLGVPYQPELAFGAIASGGVRVINEDTMRLVAELDESTIEPIVARETNELKRREALFRDGRAYPDFQDRDVVLVDDGMATGATMRAAAQAVRRRNPNRILVAVPTASAEAVSRISGDVDDLICLDTPRFFAAVGNYYRRFDQTTDEDVRTLLNEAWNARSAA